MSIDDLIAFIVEHTHTPARLVNEHSSLRDDLGIDSLQLVNLIVAITEKYRIRIESLLNEPDDLTTVGKLYGAIHRGGNSHENID